MIGHYERKSGPVCDCGREKRLRAVRCDRCAREHERQYHAEYHAEYHRKRGTVRGGREPLVVADDIRRMVPIQASVAMLDSQFPWLAGAERGEA